MNTFNFGGRGGGEFSDLSFKLDQKITGVQIRAGWFIDAIRFRYGTSWAPWHGGPGGGLHEFECENTYIKKVVVHHEKFINAIQFVMSDDKTHGPYGVQSGKYQVASYNSAEQGFLSYIKGSSGHYLDRIQLCFEADRLEEKMRKLGEHQSNYAKEKEDCMRRVLKEIETLQNKIQQREKLEEEIQDLELSAFFMTEDQIQLAKKSILEAEQINSKILLFKKSLNLPPSTKEMKLQIERAKEISRNLGSTTRESFNEAMNAVLQAQQDARQELECVLCLDIPRVDTHVFSCAQQHLFCATCSQQRLISCPVCMQSFQQTPPARNRLAEKMISRLQ